MLAHLLVAAVGAVPQQLAVDLCHSPARHARASRNMPQAVERGRTPDARPAGPSVLAQEAKLGAAVQLAMERDFLLCPVALPPVLLYAANSGNSRERVFGGFWVCQNL